MQDWFDTLSIGITEEWEYGDDCAIAPTHTQFGILIFTSALKYNRANESKEKLNISLIVGDFFRSLYFYFIASWF